VKSGKTIAQVARENGTEPNHPEEEKKPLLTKTSKTVSLKKSAIKTSVKVNTVKKKPLI
jgi:signal recognition particle subunit SEC65